LKKMKFHFTMQDDPGGQSAFTEQDVAYAGAGTIRTGSQQRCGHEGEPDTADHGDLPCFVVRLL
jgi:hypothetical protein